MKMDELSARFDEMIDKFSNSEKAILMSRIDRTTTLKMRSDKMIKAGYTYDPYIIISHALERMADEEEKFVKQMISSYEQSAALSKSRLGGL